MLACEFPSPPLPPPPVNAAIAEVNTAISSGGDLPGLLQALQAGNAHLSDVVPENLQWYMDMLSKAVKDKAEVRRRRRRRMREGDWIGVF